ncbi:LysM peptidoglycan-binding domain-containing protein, partial [Staphylococcus epidermidis]|uniref:LysM peptidoglycan-binding domain-containing protein n=1 Tax=Staphylococcus epidermidis TaxID=1282 RepID=UPI0011A36C4E
EKIMEVNGLNKYVILGGEKLKVCGKGRSWSGGKGSGCSGGSGIYSVKYGESVCGIGSKYGRRYEKIMELNGLSNLFMYGGEKLKVGGGSCSR